MSTSMPASNTPRSNLAVFAALAVLVVAIVMTVESLAWQATGFDRTPISAGTVDPTIGYAFYDALDQVLATGDSTALDAIVAGGFVDHTDIGDRSVDDLVAQFTEFGQRFPEARLSVGEITAAPGILIAAVPAFAPAGATLAGLPVRTDPQAPRFEMLRLRNGLVAERWSSALPGIELQPYADVSFELDRTFAQSVRLQRITIQPGEEAMLSVPGHVVIIAELGTVRVRTTRATSSVSLQPDTINLVAGDVWSRPSGATTRLANDSDAPVQVMVFLAQQVSTYESQISGTATVQFVWGSNLPPRKDSPMTIAIGRIGLASGQQVQFDLPVDAQLLLSVSDGSVTLDSDGVIERLDDNLWPVSVGTRGTLEQGAATSNEGDASLTVASATSSDLWAISLLPVPVETVTPVTP